MGTTISHSINVLFGANTAPMRGEMRRLNTLIKQSRAPFEQVNKDLSIIRRAMDDVQRSFSRGSVGLLEFQDRMSDLERAKNNVIDKADFERTGAIQDRARKTAEKFLSPQEKMAQGVKALDEEFETGLLNAEQYNRAIEDLEKQFYATDPVIRKLNESLRQKEALQDRARKTAERFASPQERMIQGISRLDEEFKTGLLTADQYNRAIEDLEKQFYATDPAMRRFSESMREQEDLQKRASAISLKNESDYERIERELRDLNEVYQKTSLSLRDYNREAAKIRGIQPVGLSQQKSFGLKNPFKKASVARLRSEVLGLVGAYVSLQSIFGAARRSFDFSSESIRLSTDLKRSTAALKVFTGSTLRARNVLDELRDITKSSPITFEGAQRGARTLLQFGVEVERVTDIVLQLGEITGGNQERFENLSLAYAQSQAAGRLMGQELLQMVNAGFNPLQEIARQTGVSFGELKDRMQKGKISSEQVAEAFRTATESGGRYHGILDEIAETTGGKLDKANNQLKILMTEIGDSLSPAVESALEVFEGWQPELLEAANELERISNLFSAIIEKRRDLGGLGLTMPLGPGTLGREILEIEAFKANMRNLLDPEAGDPVKPGLRLLDQLGGDGLKRGLQSIGGLDEAKANRLVDALLEAQRQEAILAQAKERARRRQFDENKEADDRAKALAEESKRTAEFREQLEELRDKRLFEERKLKFGEDVAGFLDKLKDPEINVIQAAQLQYEEFRLRIFKAQNKEIEKQNKAKKKLEEDRKKSLDDLEKTFKRQVNPLQKVTEDLAKLDLAFRNGRLNIKEFKKAEKKLLDSAFKDKSAGLPEALAAGTQEAVRFAQGQQANIQQKLLSEQRRSRIAEEVAADRLAMLVKLTEELKTKGTIRKAG